MKRTTEDIVNELLVMRSQEGDAVAWSRLVRAWQPRFYAHARRLTGHREGAKDVTQETWAAMVRSIRRLDDPARFRAWAFRILINKSADWVRKRARERRAIQEVVESVRERGAPGNHPPGEESGDRLRRAVAQLPPDRRQLLSMCYVDGMPLAEIADVLGIPEGTVKSRLHSIRQELKLLLEKNTR
jgi:RNA polymerase sigma-70 factor (ECF subfamily)